MYASGITECDEMLRDEEFNLTVTNAVKLIREVEVYQWIEHSYERNKKTFYSYRKDWRNYLV